MTHQPGHERPGDTVPHQDEVEELIGSAVKIESAVVTAAEFVERWYAPFLVSFVECFVFKPGDVVYTAWCKNTLDGTSFNTLLTQDVAGRTSQQVGGEANDKAQLNLSEGEINVIGAYGEWRDVNNAAAIRPLHVTAQSVGYVSIESSEPSSGEVTVYIAIQRVRGN